jgi:hypothetical protein
MTNRLRTEGTDHLLAAGRAIGAWRFVAQSFGAFRFAGKGGPVLTEADSLHPDPRQPGLEAILYNVTDDEPAHVSESLPYLAEAADAETADARPGVAGADHGRISRGPGIVQRQGQARARPASGVGELA